MVASIDCLEEAGAAAAVQHAASRLARASSAPAEAAPDCSQLTGTWVASGGKLKPSEVLEEGEEEEEEGGQQ